MTRLLTYDKNLTTLSTTVDLERRLKDAPLRQIGSRIRSARKDAELSHDRLAEAVGTSRQHLIALEKADHRPRVEMLTRIAVATGKTPEWFLDERDPFLDEAA